MAGHYVVRNVTRPDSEVVRGLRDAGVATVHEAIGRTGLVSPAVGPRQEGAVIAGPAVTVSSHPGDNLMIHAAVEMCRPGDVLVVTTTSPSTDGGRLIRPGDVVIADDDGVMCVPVGAAPDALTRAQARIAAEEGKRESFRAGVLGVDMYGLRELLSSLGVTYVDELPQQES
jgi:regulator of RNase E activity RraA